MAITNDIEENLKVGLLDLLILKLLTKSDSYGYKIKQDIYTLSNNTIEFKEGSLYGPFYRLEKKGYITSDKRQAGVKRFRVYYCITDEGRKYLNSGIEIFSKIYSGAMSVFDGDVKDETK